MSRVLGRRKKSTFLASLNFYKVLRIIVFFLNLKKIFVVIWRQSTYSATLKIWFFYVFSAHVSPASLCLTLELVGRTTISSMSGPPLNTPSPCSSSQRSTGGTTVARSPNVNKLAWNFFKSKTLRIYLLKFSIFEYIFRKNVC